MLQVKPLSLHEKERLKQLAEQQQRELEAKKARKQDFQAGWLLLGYFFAQRQSGPTLSEAASVPDPFRSTIQP